MPTTVAPGCREESMTESLRALLSGALDYAGMFPPVSLSLGEALANFRRYRAGPEAWMLGRFLCPANQLAELGSLYQPERDGGLSVVVAGADSVEGFWANVDACLEALRSSGLADVVE